jgi:hypothetical protein
MVCQAVTQITDPGKFLFQHVTGGAGRGTGNTDGSSWGHRSERFRGSS